MSTAGGCGARCRTMLLPWVLFFSFFPNKTSSLSLKAVPERSRALWPRLWPHGATCWRRCTSDAPTATAAARRDRRHARIDCGPLRRHAPLSNVPRKLRSRRGRRGAHRGADRGRRARAVLAAAAVAVAVAVAFVGYGGGAAATDSQPPRRGRGGRVEGDAAHALPLPAAQNR